MAQIHVCSCGRVCRGPAQPKPSTFDVTKRYRGACPVCKAKLGHGDVCAMRDAMRQRLLATTLDEMRAAPASADWRALMAPYQHSSKLTVGAITFGNESDATWYSANQDQYRASQDGARVAHDAWTAQWRAIAEAAFPDESDAGTPGAELAVAA